MYVDKVNEPGEVFTGSDNKFPIPRTCSVRGSWRWTGVPWDRRTKDGRERIQSNSKVEVDEPISALRRCAVPFDRRDVPISSTQNSFVE